MATGGGEMREQEMVPVTGASGFVGASTIRSLPIKVTARSVAVFAVVHAAVALIMFVALEQQNAQHFCQCMEACWVLSMVEVCSTMFHHLGHDTMTVCSVVQILVAGLALVSTGRLRRAASFVALCIAVATGMQSIRLVYTALFGTHCCFSGGVVQVASAIAVVFSQAAVPFWGGMVAFDLGRAPML